MCLIFSWARFSVLNCQFKPHSECFCLSSIGFISVFPVCVCIGLGGHSHFLVSSQTSHVCHFPVCQHSLSPTHSFICVVHDPATCE
ncbi:hypothetical protein OUZ56_033219 [Daphnia magna]|uniref:Secreted protein n=1 Tax=Daphnia magna TaxID=35525 RepID=A0ABR0BAH0_9CRUS|nr:hypothetical protein OUZ56_033219 [Daphnia magna]